MYEAVSELDCCVVNVSACLVFSDQEVLRECPFLCRCQFRRVSLEPYRLATKWTLRNSQKFGSGFGVIRALAWPASLALRNSFTGRVGTEERCEPIVNEYILVTRKPIVRRGNPQFTNPAAIEPPLASQTSFERVVAELRLSPSEYVTSPKLRDWVSRNKDQKYVPAELLKAFGFEVSTDL
jgi:hypothetical protein